MGAPGREAGFTMVEMLVSVAIMSVMIGLAAPMFSETLAARRVQSGAQSLAATLRMAQAEAVRRNRTVEVLFTQAEPVPGNVVSATSTTATGARGWMARVVNPTGPADFVDGVALQGDLSRLLLRNANLQSVAFTPTARPLDLSAGIAAPAALTEPLAVRVIASGTTRSLCVAVATGGSVRVCDPTRPIGDATACRPFLSSGAC